MKKAFLMLAFAALVLTMPSPHTFAGPQTMDLMKLPPLATYGMSPDEYKAKTKEFSDNPGDDKFLAYTVDLPQGWSKPDGHINKVDISQDIMSEIGHFYGPPQIDERSFFTVQVTQLTYEVTAKNWLLNYVLSHGYSLQGFKQLSMNEVEASYAVFQNNTSYAVRVKAQINGTRMIVAMYYCPESHWKAERSVQEQAIDSFKLTNIEQTQIEPTRTYGFLDLLKFDYPQSWRLQAPNILSVESMGANIINATANGTLNGQIDVHVISTELDTTLPQEIKKLQGQLNDKGLEIGKLIEQPNDLKPQPQVYYSRFEVYQANDKNKELMDYEYWIGVMIENRYYYIVTMLTPARTADFATWARNSAAYRTVVDSIRLK